MAAQILEFKKPEKKAEFADIDSLTKKEFHERVLEETLFRCRGLVTYYKGTGQWTDESCETAMVDAIHALKRVCKTLVDNKDKKPDEAQTVS